MAIAGELMIKMHADVATLRADMGNATKVVQEFVGTLKGALGAVGFAEILKGVVSNFVKAFDETRKYAAAVGDTAERLGVSTAALQAWTTAAAFAGVEADKFAAGLTKIQGTLDKAKEGNKEAIETFQRLGVHILDAKGNLRPLEELLPEIFRGIKSMGSEAERAALLVKLFGEAGAKLAGELERLAKSTGDARLEALQMGTVIDGGVIKKSQELDRNLKILELQFRATFANEVVGPMVVGLNTVIEQIVKANLKLMETAALMLGLATLNTALIAKTMNDIADRVAKFDASERPGSSTRRLKPGTKDPTVKAGGKSEEEKAREKLRDLREELERTTEQYNALATGTQRADETTADFINRVADTAAAMKTIFDATKNLPKDSPLRGQITQVVSDLANARRHLKGQAEDMKAADAITKEYGNGQLALSERLIELNRAFETGRLGIEEFNAAQKDAVRTAQEQNIKYKFGEGAVEGLHAFSDQIKELGNSIYDSFFQAGFSVQQFVATFLQQMGRAVFQMMVWTPIVKAFTSLLTNWLGGGQVDPTTGAAVVPKAAAAPAGMRASGGAVWPGAQFLVGEQGPERFVPSVPGTIEPASGGAETVVNIDMRGVPTSRGDDAASAADLARKVRAAVLDVLRNEKRPGGMLAAGV